MLFISAYLQTWPMCLFMAAYFAGMGLLTWYLRIRSLAREIPPRPVFWASVISWFVLMSACLTLIDKPHLTLSSEAKNWLFMFSAFLGIPVTMPLFAGMVWALAAAQYGKAVRTGELALVAMGSFALGCAVSNVHDVVWCGIITQGYSQHYEAGYDLDIFVAFGEWFGISREILADYVTLGPCALLMVAGELAVAMAAFVRLRRLSSR